MQLVGSFVNSHSKVQQPLIAERNCLWLLSHATCGFDTRMQLQGDSSPTLTGIAMKSYCSFATIVSNCLNGILSFPHDVDQIHQWNMVSSFPSFCRLHPKGLFCPVKIELK
jgi:hypothetical protein